jgi:hypothetical protein
MKTYFVILVACAGFFLHSCGESLLDSRYSLKMPEIPQSWEILLGRPYWRVEWLNNEGRTETMTLRSNENGEISLPQTWANAVIAMPFWPDRGLRPGIFRPAGAIFPFDASGKSLVLSWRGGIDAHLFGEFVKVAAEATAEAEAGQETVPSPGEELPEEAPVESTLMGRAAVPRLPSNFDWPRFRLLFEDPSVNAEVRADPWLADWHSIAAKIVQSGFDKRRLVPEPRINLTIPLSNGINYGIGRGPWIGTSPFAAPLLFEAEPVFPVRPTADTWVSDEGILRCNTEAWIFMKWE